MTQRPRKRQIDSQANREIILPQSTKLELAPSQIAFQFEGPF